MECNLLMTDISKVQTSITKSNLTIQELNNEFEDKIKVTQKGLEDLKNPIEELIDFKKKRKEEIATYESSNDALTREVSTLKEEKNSNKIQLSEKQSNLSELVDKRAKMETRLRETNSELSETKNKLTGSKDEYSNYSEANKKLSDDIVEIVSSSEVKVLELDKKVEAKRDTIRRIQGERMALEYLIKKNHVEFNELKIINSLEGRKNSDLTTISKVTGISDALIIKTLDGLMKRNLITYDSSSGVIVITRSLKL